MGKLCLFKNWLLCFKGTEFARTSLAEAAAHALWLGSATSASQPLGARHSGSPPLGRAVLALQVMEGKLDSLYLCVHQQSC